VIAESTPKFQKGRDWRRRLHSPSAWIVLITSLRSSPPSALEAVAVDFGKSFPELQARSHDMLTPNPVQHFYDKKSPGGSEVRLVSQ